jgi:hypothetical protein
MEWKGSLLLMQSLTFRVHGMLHSTMPFPAPWLPDVEITSVITFLNFFMFARTEILTHCVFTILLEASKIATDLFIIKLCICKGFVYMVTFLWHFKNHDIFWHIHSFHTAGAICSFFGGPQNVRSQTNVEMHHSLSLPHFIKSIPLTPFYIKQYIGIQRIFIHNEKRYLWLCSLLLLVRCWSHCNLVWKTISQMSKHSPTSQLWHLYFVCINTQPHIALWKFKSYIGLFFVDHMTPYFLPFWCHWSLFCTLSQLVEGFLIFAVGCF